MYVKLAGRDAARNDFGQRGVHPVQMVNRGRPVFIEGGFNQFVQLAVPQKELGVPPLNRGDGGAQLLARRAAPFRDIDDLDFGFAEQTASDSFVDFGFG